jgi:uncharacterized protein (TIGR03790 family)
VAVVVNQLNADSVELGNYYCERRGVPPQNLFRMTTWGAGRTSWSLTHCLNHLVDPLHTALVERGLANQIDYVVLSMGIPYQVLATNGVNSTTAILYYGFKPDEGTMPFGASCTLPEGAANPFVFSEDMFRHVPPGDAGGGSHLATMITGGSLASAKLVVDRGLASDGVFPTQTVWLARTWDAARSVRHVLFDNTLLDARVRGAPSVIITNLDSPAGLSHALGLETGLAQLQLATNAFVPGAVADSLTSFGGMLFVATGQTDLLAFLAAGASGSYGTVVEPCNYTEKFPNPEVYFYQARGFSLAESYYLSLQHPYQGLIAGEPLAAPYARPGTGAWVGLTPDAWLAGTTNLALRFFAAGAARPLQQVDVFLDGTLLQTVTNVVPAAGNLLTVTLNGVPIEYTVPSDATVKSVTAGLAAALNEPETTNLTQVVAYGHGDRIELQSLDPDRAGADVTASVSSRQGAGPFLTTAVSVSRGTFVETTAYARGDLMVSNTAPPGAWLRLEIVKADGKVISLSRTNSPTGGTMSDLVLGIHQAVAAHRELQGPDGVVPDDYGSSESYGEPLAGFSLRARTPGWAGAQIQARWSGSPEFAFFPAAANHLDSNLTDLRPRNHLYLTAGVTNLGFVFPLDTSLLADGWHELAAVAYQGDHVRTQTRATQGVRVRNTRLEATLSVQFGDMNTAVEATLELAVAVNTPNAARIELFSTGGLLRTVTGEANAAFLVEGRELGIGLHRFYALVTDTSGRQYRTETAQVRLVGPDAPFALAVAGNPLTLSWRATTGRTYEVLGADRASEAFTVRAQITPAHGLCTWTDPAPTTSARYYRVRSAPSPGAKQLSQAFAD